MRRGSGAVYGARGPVDAEGKAPVEVSIDERIVRRQDVAQHVTRHRDETRLFVRVIGVVMIRRIGGVKGELQIVIVRMIAVIMGMGIVCDDDCRRVLAQRMRSGRHGREYEHGKACQHGHYPGPES